MEPHSKVVGGGPGVEKPFIKIESARDVDPVHLLDPGEIAFITHIRNEPVHAQKVVVTMRGGFQVEMRGVDAVRWFNEVMMARAIRTVESTA